MPRKTRRPKPAPRAVDEERSDLRIVGGTLRGRKLLYSGDERTRPMKERVREAVFNLIGPRVVGTHAIDLFAGTGALGLEALSRGAATATLVEQHFPTADIIRRNVEMLGLAERSEVYPGNAFIWSQRQLPPVDRPWLVFSSPPYVFYTEREADMLALLSRLFESAPPASTFVVEADERFDMSHLPHPSGWQIRAYPPAIVAIQTS
ncbi:MAG TPA: RsmD family RNA methyltransferase [Pirellulales bacterium]|jgi:16S rRNA (guanine966-N2)-methyltransferase